MPRLKIRGIPHNETIYDTVKPMERTFLLKQPFLSLIDPNCIFSSKLQCMKFCGSCLRILSKRSREREAENSPGPFRNSNYHLLIVRLHSIYFGTATQHCTANFVLPRSGANLGSFGFGFFTVS